MILWRSDYIGRHYMRSPRSASSAHHCKHHLLHIYSASGNAHGDTLMAIAYTCRYLPICLLGMRGYAPQHEPRARPPKAPRAGQIFDDDISGRILHSYLFPGHCINTRFIAATPLPQYDTIIDKVLLPMIPGLVCHAAQESQVFVTFTSAIIEEGKQLAFVFFSR